MCVRLRIRHASDVFVARRKVQEVGVRVGLSEAAIAALATAASEVARNIVVHAGVGEILVGTLADSSRHGVVVIARDSGPGILDIAQAMHDGHSTAASLGLGLPSARRLVDEFDIESTVGVGTTVTLRKWTSPKKSPKR